MKSSIVVLIALGVAVAGGTMLYHRHSAAPSVPVIPAAATSSARPAENPPPASTMAEPKSPGMESVSSATASPTVADETKPGAAINATPFSRTMAALVSPQTGFKERQALWKQFREAGELDQAIDALKKGATEHPEDPAWPTALGEAEINKIREVRENNGDYNSIAILGLQADQNFDAALKLDPANWEAQYYKAAALANWPAEMNKGPEVIQQLSNLIDQQEALPSQPQFALTYLLLGEQYQRSGQSDYAVQTWKLGAARFPDNATLRKKISGAR
jgi:hypothetical protein